MVGIYKITSPSGRVYIGKSKNLKKRIKDYKYQCETRKSIIHDSIRGYGWENHTLEIIEECENEKLTEREIFWIKELNSYWQDNPKGMNMTRGGEAGGGGWMYDTERRKKQAERFSGEGGTFYGKKHSEETKRIIGEKASKRNLENGNRIPAWGAEKGRLAKIRAILCYNNKGEFVREFESSNMASKELNIVRGSITDSLLYGSWYKGTYLFKYKTENYPTKIEVGEIKMQTVKRSVLALNPDLEIIFEFTCAEVASEFFGIPKPTINRACMYNWLHPIRTGHIFIYKDLYAEIFKEVA